MNASLTSQDYVESSGNIFADMGLEEADKLLIRAQLGYSVRQTLKERELKQREIADLLNIKQSEVSLLMQGKYHFFSEGRLFNFLIKNLFRWILDDISSTTAELWHEYLLETVRSLSLNLCQVAIPLLFFKLRCRVRHQHIYVLPHKFLMR